MINILSKMILWHAAPVYNLLRWQIWWHGKGNFVLLLKNKNRYICSFERFFSFLIYRAVLLGICIFPKASFPHLSSGAGFWEILAPSIHWEIAPSILVGVWCACDLGASLEVSFRLGFRILLRSPISQSLFFSILVFVGNNS